MRSGLIERKLNSYSGLSSLGSRAGFGSLLCSSTLDNLILNSQCLALSEKSTDIELLSHPAKGEKQISSH